MQEIKPGIIHPAEQRTASRGTHIVPAHVWHWQRDGVVASLESSNPSRNPAETGTASLVAAVGKHLHTDADTEHRRAFVANQFLHSTLHAAGVEQVHRVIERPHSWQD